MSKQQPFIVQYYSNQLAVQMAHDSTELLAGSEVQSTISYETAKELVAEMDALVNDPAPKPVAPTLSTEEVEERIRAGAYEPTVDPSIRPDTVAFANNRKAVREERRALLVQFEADAINATGLAGHPKAEGIFNYAYSQDHAYGLEEVLSTLSELAEVLL